MLVLRGSPASPFGRKVRIAAVVLGLDREVTIEPADTADPDDSIRQQNPLGKIPALMLEDGTVLLRFAGDPRISRSSRRRRHASFRASRARASPRCGCRRCATASWMRRSCRSTRAAGGRRSSTSRNGSTTRPARSRARSPRWRPRRRRSVRSRTSVRSRSPARSAIAICASTEAGARGIRAWWPGSSIRRAVPAFAATGPAS